MPPQRVVYATERWAGAHQRSNQLIVTSKTTLDAYEAIAVPELWIYDSGKLTIYQKDWV